MGCTAESFYVFVSAVGEGEALEEIMTFLHSPHVDCLFIMTICRNRLDLLRFRCLRFAGSNSPHRGGGVRGGRDGRGGGGGGGESGGGGGGDFCCLSLNTSSVSTDLPGPALRSLQSWAV